MRSGYGKRPCCALGFMLEQHAPKLLDAMEEYYLVALEVDESDHQLHRVWHWMRRNVSPNVTFGDVCFIANTNDLTRFDEAESWPDGQWQIDMERRQRLVGLFKVYGVDLHFSDERVP
jgi:hypothetical protein